jgi:hypothetical protein
MLQVQLCPPLLGRHDWKLSRVPLFSPKKVHLSDQKPEGSSETDPTNAT